MAVPIRVPRNETEVPLNLLINSGGPLTGATAVVAIRDGDTDDSYLDFNDQTFKTVGHTTRQAALTEGQVGVYTLSGGLNLSTITNLPAATDHLIAEYEITAPSAAAAIVMDIVYLDDRVEDLNDLAIADVQTALTNQGYTAARAPNLDNLDATVSSRSSHSAADVWAVGSRTLTALGFVLDATDLAPDTIGASEFAQAAADKVWLSAARTRTALGFVLDATDLAPDTIGASEFSQAAADKVWASAARTLTGLGFALTSTDFTAAYYAQVAADVWAATTRTLTALGFSLTDTDFTAAFFSRIWTNASRTLTALGFTLGTADFAAAFLTSALFAANAIDANAFSQAAADKVWASVTRTLTALGVTLTDTDFTAAFFTAIENEVWDADMDTHVVANSFAIRFTLMRRLLANRVIRTTATLLTVRNDDDTADLFTIDLTAAGRNLSISPVP